ncbi:hypothetical protein VT84_25345 [Gemmata sp. SH-PL17]|uniref:hypothetical protein n=1 Tax=Gemmata sp. SH-PL17 TaxID=1630693 RepID=UPI0004AEC7C0|nr:hypothetical protein [Gemmata sp. SH-PL17]AMV27752.1 hypothetical protein VT84_25345 [Gemmata sp. SH-PL17]
MEHFAQFALAGAGGLLAGFLFGYALLRASAVSRFATPTITINSAPCASGRITIGGVIDPNNDEFQLRAIHVKVYDDPTKVVPANPLGEGGVIRYAVTALPIVHPVPGGTSGNDLVAVWGEYTAWNHGSKVYPACAPSGSSSSSTPMRVVAPELDAVPREFRVELAAPDGAVSGPAAQLVGALRGAAAPVLRYVLEGSTPADPVWRGLNGTDAVHETSLRLMHRADGTGALLRAAMVVAGQRVELTWVTSKWCANGASRFVCESDQPGIPALVVTPA